jgi:hypothetical protein
MWAFHDCILFMPAQTEPVFNIKKPLERATC